MEGSRKGVRTYLVEDEHSFFYHLVSEFNEFEPSLKSAKNQLKS